MAIQTEELRRFAPWDSGRGSRLRFFNEWEIQTVYNLSDGGACLIANAGLSFVKPPASSIVSDLKKAGFEVARVKAKTGSIACDADINALAVLRVKAKSIMGIRSAGKSIVMFYGGDEIEVLEPCATVERKIAVAKAASAPHPALVRS